MNLKVQKSSIYWVLMQFFLASPIYAGKLIDLFVLSQESSDSSHISIQPNSTYEENSTINALASSMQNGNTEHLHYSIRESHINILSAQLTQQLMDDFGHTFEDASNNPPESPGNYRFMDEGYLQSIGVTDASTVLIYEINAQHLNSMNPMTAGAGAATPELKACNYKSRESTKADIHGNPECSPEKYVENIFTRELKYFLELLKSTKHDMSYYGATFRFIVWRNEEGKLNLHHYQTLTALSCEERAIPAATLSSAPGGSCVLQ
ncbi:hypothetical protein [Endozoicomonas euniceicola]|uniref:Uncharacterized protein n=1 Tax=Endozoicomonas euniceicola TaxID=1234143 RepID=A0ABY6GZ68_9GAMM|nr:hypothetical protein [Endozoicomonas euniceicola]UYM17679.1 hypothetical protein NX720_07170 [Endozoicomonas euniceicola]